MPGHDWIWVARVEIVHVVDLLASHLQHVPEAARRQQRGLRALALYDRVGGERGAVHDETQRLRRGPGVRENLPHAANQRPCGIVRVREHLVNADLAGLDVVEREVRKRPANVYA